MIFFPTDLTLTYSTPVFLDSPNKTPDTYYCHRSSHLKMYYSKLLVTAAVLATAWLSAMVQGSALPHGIPAADAELAARTDDLCCWPPSTPRSEPTLAVA
jgi:hypothetical protein